jgi:hypothetical protein
MFFCSRVHIQNSAQHFIKLGPKLIRRAASWTTIEVVRPPLPEPPRDDVNWQNYTPHFVVDGTRCWLMAHPVVLVCGEMVFVAAWQRYLVL